MTGPYYIITNNTIRPAAIITAKMGKYYLNNATPPAMVISILTNGNQAREM
jgi:hypothetical protein